MGALWGPTCKLTGLPLAALAAIFESNDSFVSLSQCDATIMSNIENQNSRAEPRVRY